MRNSHSNRMNMAAGPGTQLFCKLLLLTLWLATSISVSEATEQQCTPNAKDGSKTCLHNQEYMPELSHLTANQLDSPHIEKAKDRTFRYSTSLHPPTIAQDHLIAKKDTDALKKLLRVTPEDEWTAEETKDSEEEYDFTDYTQDYSDNSREHLSEESDFSERDSEDTSKPSQSDREESQDYSEDYMYSEESQDYSKEDYGNDDIEEIEKLLTSRDKRGWLSPWDRLRLRTNYIKKRDKEFRDQYQHIKQTIAKAEVQIYGQRTDESSIGQAVQAGVYGHRTYKTSIQQAFGRVKSVKAAQKRMEQQIRFLIEQVPQVESVEANVKKSEHQFKSLEKQFTDRRSTREDHGLSNKQQYSKPVQRRDTFETTENRNPTEIEDSEYSEEEYDFTDSIQDYSDNSREYLSEESDFSERDSEDTSKASQSDREESQDYSEDYVYNEDSEDYSKGMEEKSSSHDKRRQYKRDLVVNNYRRGIKYDLAVKLKKYRVEVETLKTHLEEFLLKIKNVFKGNLAEIESAAAAQKELEQKIESVKSQVPKIEFVEATQKELQQHIKLLEKQVAYSHHSAQRRDTFETRDRNPTKIEDSEYSEEEYDFTDYTQDYSDNSREHLSEESDFSERDSEDTSKPSQEYSQGNDGNDDVKEVASLHDKRRAKYDVWKMNELKQALDLRNRKLLNYLDPGQKALAQQIKFLEKEVTKIASMEVAQKEAQQQIESLKKQFAKIDSLKAAQKDLDQQIESLQKQVAGIPLKNPQDRKQIVHRIAFLKSKLTKIMHEIKSLEKKLTDSRTERRVKRNGKLTLGPKELVEGTEHKIEINGETH